MPGDTAPAEAPKLLDRVRNLIRLEPCSMRTEESYVHWIEPLASIDGVEFCAKRAGEGADRALYQRPSLAGMTVPSG